MRCVNCGHELKDGAIYCIRCGTMQVSMDGKPVERDHMGRASDHTRQWPEVEPQANGAGFRSSTEEAMLSANERLSGARHGREFQPAPKRNGGRIAVIIIALIAIAAIIAVVAFNCMGPGASGTESSSVESSETASSETTSSTSSSSTSSASTSASASSASASASSASASAASASASSAAAQQQQQQQQEPAPTIVEEQPAPTVNDYYVLGDSSSRYYSRGELENMGTYDLYLARNEIFARHGRMFQRSDLQDYFNSQAWYTPLYTPAQWDSMGNQLNDYELKNSSLMKQVEASKGSPYL